jgi:hypothetical protein
MDHDHDELKPGTEPEASAPAAEPLAAEPPALKPAVLDAAFGIEVSCVPEGLSIEVTDYHATRLQLSWERVKELLAAARESGYTE